MAAAHRVQEAARQGASIRCTLLEGADRLGGKLRTERRDGFILEHGPDSFISQKPAGIELCRKLGIEKDLTGTKTDHPQTFVYLNRKMVTLPDGLSLMVPTKFLPFVTTRLFTWPGKVRMGLDLFIPRSQNGGDESLASFVRRRLGEEAVQRLAQPLLAGIFASDPEEMSLQATFPMFLQTERKYGSLIRGMLARKRQMLLKRPDRPPGYQPFSMFVTLKNGISQLVEAIVDKSPDITFRTGARITELEKSETGYTISLPNGETLAADAVIVATPAPVTAPLLSGMAPAAAARLKEIPYVSTAAVVLGYKKEGFGHPLRGFGFVAPATEGRRITACTWVSSKFPGRAPDDKVLLRAFVGGALCEAEAERSPDAILSTVLEELRDIMGLRAEPEFTRVFRYPKGNVQYRVHHAGLIDSVERDLAALPGLYLAGSPYRGVGIPDCIANGTAVAQAALKFLE